MKDFGYEGLADFVRSFLRPELIKSKMVLISTLTGTLIEVVTKFTEVAFGFSQGIFILLLVLLFFEFVTGIAASLYEYKHTNDSTKKFSSRRFNGGGLKAMMWLLFIAVFWRLYMDLEIDWIKTMLHGLHGAVIVFVFLSYITSIAENMVRLGVKEFSWIVKLTKKKIRNIEKGIID